MFYNSQHSFIKFQEISDLKELPLDSMHKKLNDFHNQFTGINKTCSTNKGKRRSKSKSFSFFFNELYYIYKERYKEEKNVLNKNDLKKCYYAKLRLTEGYQYDSNEEEEQTDKTPDEKEPPKKSRSK